jgi:hypothetical protein
MLLFSASCAVFWGSRTRHSVVLHIRANQNGEYSPCSKLSSIFSVQLRYLGARQKLACWSLSDARQSTWSLYFHSSGPGGRRFKSSLPRPIPGECNTTNEEVADIPRKLYEGILIEQLASWFTDTTTWAQDRSFDVFCRWFDLQHHSMLVDLCDEPPVRASDC